MFFKLNLFNMFFVVRHVVVIYVSYRLCDSCPRTVKRLLTAEYVFNCCQLALMPVYGYVS